MPAPPDLPTILAAITVHPNEALRWLALASWLWDNGRDDEAAAIGTFWPVLRDNLVEAGVSLEETLRLVERNAVMLGRRAREVEGRRGTP